MAKKLFRFADFFMSPQKLIFFGILFGLLVARLHWWDWLEPVTGIATLAFAAAGWWQGRKAEKAYYEISDNHDDSWVVALEVAGPISEATKEQFGHLDVLVRAQDVIGTVTLIDDEHYKKLAQAVYSACALAQNRQIELILSGPIGLSTLIGQMLGLVKFKVTVWQYYNGTYKNLPRPTMDWLEHRN